MGRWYLGHLENGCGLMELRSLYEHLQARIMEMIEAAQAALT
jgi:hypothetical protein